MTSGTSPRELGVQPYMDLKRGKAHLKAWGKGVEMV